MSSDLSDPVVHLITEARVQLLFKKPFFGNLSCRLELVDASKWCKSCATDGKRLYYNRDFMLKLTKNELLFLIGHNVMHCVYDQLGRRGNRNPQLWDMAADYMVNYSLVTDKFGQMPEGGLYNPAYTDEMTTEEIYDLLVKDSVTIKMPLDEHLDLGDDGDGDGQGGTVDVTVIGQNGPPKLSAEDLQQIRSEMRAAMLQAAQAVGAGNVPAGVMRMIGDYLEPKLDWRTLLDAHIRSSVKDDYTFNRISKRSWGLGMILPTQNFMDTIDIAICVDASGSLSDEMLRDFKSEVKGIMEQFRAFTIKMWSFDTEIYSFKEFTEANLDELDTWSPGGGGGTSFNKNWEFMKEKGIEPARLVFLTDGLTGDGWGDEGYCDTLWVIYGQRQVTPPYGVCCHYDPS